MKKGRRHPILMGERQTTVFQRAVARGIDGVVIGILICGLRVVWSPLGWLAGALYAALQDSFGEGQSIGKKIMGIQVVDEATGLACSCSHSFLRNVPWVLSLVCAPVPVLEWFALSGILLFSAFEGYLILTLDSGVRLGDVMGNTSVVERYDEGLGAEQPS